MQKRSERSRSRSSAAVAPSQRQNTVVEKPRRQIAVYDAVAGTLDSLYIHVHRPIQMLD